MNHTFEITELTFCQDRTSRFSSHSTYWQNYSENDEILGKFKWPFSFATIFRKYLKV